MRKHSKAPSSSSSEESKESANSSDGRQMKQTQIRGEGQKWIRAAEQIAKVGQNRTYALYITVYLAISLPKIPYVHRVYMVLANPTSSYNDMRITTHFPFVVFSSIQSSIGAEQG